MPGEANKNDKDEKSRVRDRLRGLFSNFKNKISRKKSNNEKFATVDVEYSVDNTFLFKNYVGPAKLLNPVL